MPITQEQKIFILGGNVGSRPTFDVGVGPFLLSLRPIGLYVIVFPMGIRKPKKCDLRADHQGPRS